MNNNKFKICIAVLLIVIISLIGFVGIFEKQSGVYVNVIKDLNYSMDLGETRLVTLTIDDSSYEETRDENGNLVDTSEEDEEGTVATNVNTVTNTILYNPEEVLTSENYEKSREVLEKRLEKAGVEDFDVRVDDESGVINIEIKNSSTTDESIGTVLAQGKFEIRDSKTGEVLLDNSDIKKVSAMYSTQSSGLSSNSVIVFLDFKFTSEGKKKLEDISTKYLTVESTTETSSESEDIDKTEEELAEETEEVAQEEEPEQLTVDIYLDDTKMLSTSFDEAIPNGEFQLSYGSSSSDTDSINSNLKSANQAANLITSGAMPVKYTVSDNINIETKTTRNVLNKYVITIGILTIVCLMYYVYKYKVNGLLAVIGYIGFVATYILCIRYTNTTVSIPGIFAMVLVLILNYILTLNYLKNVKGFKNKIRDNLKQEENKLLLNTILNNLMILIPVIVICIDLIFANRISINSFGMLLFWGLVVSFLYNYLLTFQMVKLNNEDEILKGDTNE